MSAINKTRPNGRSLYLLCISLLFTVPHLAAQDEPVELDYFSIMVLPYTSGSERVSNILETNPDMRSAITELESTLIALNLRVMDFTARYDAYKAAHQLKDTDTKASFLSYAKPEIHCELSIEDVPCPSDRHKARVIVKTYFTSSGRLLFSTTEDSNCFVAAAEHLQLVRRAIRLIDVGFQEQLKNSLQKMARTGQSFDLLLVTEEDSSLNFETKVTGYGQYPTLGTSLNAWLENMEESEVIFFRPTTTSPRELRYDEVRIPFYIGKSKRLYQITTFEQHLQEMVNKLKLAGTERKITASIRRQNGILTVLFEEY